MPGSAAGRSPETPAEPQAGRLALARDCTSAVNGLAFSGGLSAPDRTAGGMAPRLPGGTVGEDVILGAGSFSFPTGYRYLTGASGPVSIDAGMMTTSTSVLAGIGGTKLFGSAGSNQVFTGTGNDTVFARATDAVAMGSGTNAVLLSTSASTVFGGSGASQIVDAGSRKSFVGGSGSTLLFDGRAPATCPATAPCSEASATPSPQPATSRCSAA